MRTAGSAVVNPSVQVSAHHPIVRIANAELLDLAPGDLGSIKVLIELAEQSGDTAKQLELLRQQAGIAHDGDADRGVDVSIDAGADGLVREGQHHRPDDH